LIYPHFQGLLMFGRFHLPNTKNFYISMSLVSRIQYTKP